MSSSAVPQNSPPPAVEDPEAAEQAETVPESAPTMAEPEETPVEEPEPIVEEPAATDTASEPVAEEPQEPESPASASSSSSESETPPVPAQPTEPISEEPEASSSPTAATEPVNEETGPLTEPKPVRKPTIAEIESLLAGDLVLVPAQKASSSSNSSASSELLAVPETEDTAVDLPSESCTDSVPSVEGTELPSASKVPTSITSTTATKLSASEKLKFKIAIRLAVFRCPKEVIPIILYVRQKKKEGVDVKPIVEAMLNVGAVQPGAGAEVV